MKRLILCFILMLALVVPVYASDAEHVVEEETININELSEYKEIKSESEDGNFEIIYKIEEEQAQVAAFPIFISHTSTKTNEYLGYYFFRTEETTLSNGTSNDMNIDDLFEVKAYCKASGSISSGIEDYAEASLGAEFGKEITKSRTISTTINPGERMAYAPEYKKYKVTEFRKSLYPELFDDETNIGYVWVPSGLYYYTENF